MRVDFDVWQLADSAFPSGGFMHSAGLEAAWQHGEVRSAADLVHFAATALAQVAHSQLPFAIAAFREPERLDEWDRRLDAMLSNHVANRASRRQGQALLASAGAVFERESLQRLHEERAGSHGPCHSAVVFGAVCAQLGLDERTTSQVLLFVTLRGIISAAVRLGIVGPLEGQQIQHRLSANALQIAHRSPQPDVAATQTAPLIDVLQATHDRLYSRLFQS